MFFMMKLTILDLKNLALIWGKILFIQPLKLHEKLFTKPFYVRKFLSPNPLLFGTNPSVNNERSLGPYFHLPLHFKSETLEKNLFHQNCVILKINHKKMIIKHKLTIHDFQTNHLTIPLLSIHTPRVLYLLFHP